MPSIRSYLRANSDMPDVGRNVRSRPNPKTPTKWRKAGMYKKSVKITPNMKKVVQSVIDGRAEKKMVQFFNNAGLNTSVLASDWSAFNAWVLTSDTTSRAMYAIAQGTGQGSRVGNQVRTYKMTMKLALFANPQYGATTNYNACPLFVTLWVVKLDPHLEDTMTTLQAVVQSSFFQASGATAAFTGDLSDLIKTPNRDQVTVLLRKVYKVGLAEYISGAGDNVSNTLNNRYMNNDSSFAIIDTVDFTKYVPTVQSFNDGDNLTTSRRTYMFFTSARVDGNPTNTNLGFATGTRPYQTSIGIDYQFTDL